MKAELAALMALGKSRRAAGQPCNPMREGWDDIDWLDESELQRAHCLNLRIEMAEWAAVGVAA